MSAIEFGPIKTFSLTRGQIFDRLIADSIYGVRRSVAVAFVYHNKECIFTTALISTVVELDQLFHLVGRESAVAQFLGSNSQPHAGQGCIKMAQLIADSAYCKVNYVGAKYSPYGLPLPSPRTNGSL